MRKFFALHYKDQFLLLEVFILLGFSRFLLLAVPFKTVAPFLGQSGIESPDFISENQLKIGKKIAWGVNLMSRHTLWESKCLGQAITAKIMLRRRKINSTIYLGVSRDEEKKMIAHAWLRCGDMILTGNRGRERFTVVGLYSDRK